MPFTLFPPKPGRSPFYRVRGREFGVRINRSTQTSVERDALRFLSKWREEARRQALETRNDDKPKKAIITFAKAATAYMHADRPSRFLSPLIRYFGLTPLAEIDQGAIDEAAKKLYPDASAQTRNRQVYSPVSAIMRHSGLVIALRRPKGALGKPRTAFLTLDQATALLNAASATHERFGALLNFLLYTGVRLSEALRLEWDDIDFGRSVALMRETKNGSAITVHMPPDAVAALKNLKVRKGRVFRLTKSGRLYALWAEAEKMAGLELPARSAFHVLRHTHATWRRLYTGADTTALTQTGLWRSRNAAAVYEHVDATAESRKSDLLPSVRKSKKVVRSEKNQ